MASSRNIVFVVEYLDDKQEMIGYSIYQSAYLVKQAIKLSYSKHPNGVPSIANDYISVQYPTGVYDKNEKLILRIRPTIVYDSAEHL